MRATPYSCVLLGDPGTGRLAKYTNQKIYKMASFMGDLWRKVGELKLNSSGNKASSSFPFVFNENKPTGQVIGPFKQFEGQEFETPGKEESIFRRVSIFSCKERGKIEEAKRIVKGLKTLKHPRILQYISSKESDSEVLLVTEWAEPFQFDLNNEEWETWGRWSVQQVYEFLKESRNISVAGDSGNLWISASGEVKVAVFNETSGDFEEISEVMKRTFPSAKAEKNEFISLTESFDYLVTFSSGERVNLIKKLFNFKNARFLKFLALPELVRTRKLIGNVTGAGQQEVTMEEVQFLFVKGKELLIRETSNDSCGASNDFLFLLSDLYCELLGKHATNTIPMTACLLDQMGSQGLCQLFTEKYAQDKIYPHVSVLLGHPMPAMRESALKALESLCDKLSVKTLGNEVLRQMARLQGDSEGVLRLRAIGMLAGPLWPKLPDTLKSKICGPAVARALSDPFTPCRRSGLALLRQGLPLLSPSEVATKVIPAVATLLIEPDVTVRGEAFECMEKMILPALKRSVVNASKSPESVNVTSTSMSNTSISNNSVGSAVISSSNSISKSNTSKPDTSKTNTSENHTTISSSITNTTSNTVSSALSSTLSGKMKLGSIKKIV